MGSSSFSLKASLSARTGVVSPGLILLARFRRHLNLSLVNQTGQRAFGAWSVQCLSLGSEKMWQISQWGSVLERFWWYREGRELG